MATFKKAVVLLSDNFVTKAKNSDGKSFYFHEIPFKICQNTFQNMSEYVSNLLSRVLAYFTQLNTT